MSFRCFLFLAVILFMFNSCASSIAMYDQYAYTQVTSIKVDALELMDQADQDYASSEKDIKELDVKMKKAIEYERHRPKNEIVSAMWAKIADPEAFLYGGFLVRWKNQKKLNAEFIQDQKKIVGIAFDQIAELQSKMVKRK